MKKTAYLLLSLFSILTIGSCSSDDDKGENDVCVICTKTVNGESYSKEVCNVDGMAYDGDINMEIPYDDYIASEESIGYTCTGN